ncbi:MAG: helix-turn-helix transcriptional regulator [Syntrophobacteraceae bacterium]
MKNRRIVAVHGIRKEGQVDSGPRHEECKGTDGRLVEKRRAMKKTNFDQYLEEQLQDPAFADRFDRAGEAWDMALQIAALRREAGLSQKELAILLKTSQQQIGRLESPGYIAFLNRDAFKT